MAPLTSPGTELATRLRATPKAWLVTGVSGFIGSHLLEALLRLDQCVVGLDNFATGHQRNIDEVKRAVAPAQWENFTFLRGDIRNQADCRRALRAAPGRNEPAGQAGIDYVLHQAALGSVPRSLLDPVTTNETNIGGFLNMLVAAREAGVARFVYAASSSTYGDEPNLPKIEDRIGRPLSPYAVTKYVNELYADVFARSYGFGSIGLRYFNVFGPRQDPEGAYAAVIPKWTASLLRGETVWINGDGESSRDFCYVANVVQANLLAATTDRPEAINQVYNIAVGDRTTLNRLFASIRDALSSSHPLLQEAQPKYRDFRPGDVRHSLADISKARQRLGYDPQYRLQAGLDEAMGWYVSVSSALPAEPPSRPA